MTKDFRDVLRATEKGNSKSMLALSIQDYQIKKYIGAYAAAMGGLNVVAFTGGIGEMTRCTDTKSATIWNVRNSDRSCHPIKTAYPP